MTRALSRAAALLFVLVTAGSLLTIQFAFPAHAQPSDRLIQIPLYVPPRPLPPARPSREAVISAMASVDARVRMCRASVGSVVRVAVTFASNGRVRSVSFQFGQFADGRQLAGTRAGDCILAAVRGAQVPPFAEATFSFVYPFRL